MDDLECSGEIVHKTLHEIEFINRWLGGNSITLNAVQRVLLKNKSKDIVHIADLGCGGGGMLVEIAKLARKLDVKVKLLGFDANPNIIEYARADNRERSNIEFLCMDIFSQEFQSMKFDIVICTLVAHHFSNDQLSLLFSNLRSQANLAVIINDLERNPFAYYSIKILTKFFSQSSMVKYDAPLSVLRGFKREELQMILKKAQIRQYSISWRWAFRWELTF